MGITKIEGQDLPRNVKLEAHLSQSLKQNSSIKKNFIIDFRIFSDWRFGRYIMSTSNRLIQELVLINRFSSQKLGSNIFGEWNQNQL